MRKLTIKELDDYEVTNVYQDDYPRFVDAVLLWAIKDGVELSEEELEYTSQDQGMPDAAMEHFVNE